MTAGQIRNVMMFFFWVLATCLHGAKAQKNIIVLTAMKTSNLTNQKYVHEEIMGALNCRLRCLLPFNS
jgi:hypothetical protein